MSLLKPAAKTNCTKAVVDMKNNQVTITVNGDEIRMDQLGNVGDKTSPCFSTYVQHFVACVIF